MGSLYLLHEPAEEPGPAHNERLETAIIASGTAFKAFSL